uniref:Uncharacterized protein n=1 Tax=Mucochytrium quahogii TaxID=96639 RepID=A0A7S2WJE2_9STRA|mmetsp:Transcript_6218/g.9809  ORF Transcript_6218/g.9809 Transcript_6218/m.9809 type:complete len:442 (-) Transcript_6218:1879-3204(-)
MSVVHVEVVHLQPAALSVAEVVFRSVHVKPVEFKPLIGEVDGSLDSKPVENDVAQTNGAEGLPQSDEEALLKTLTKRQPRDVEIVYPDDDAAGRLKYVGSVKNNVPHGRGSLTWVCGSRYDGIFKNDKLTGKGIYTWNNGKAYIGEWLDGKAHGFGTLKSKDNASEGMEYRGFWKDGLMHGFGKLRLENKDTYQGGWAYNNKHGCGTYTWRNGDRFEGWFDNHQMQGRGVYSWPNGRNLELKFDKHFPEECWKLSYILWGTFFFLNVAYVALVLVYDKESLDASLLSFGWVGYGLGWIGHILSWPLRVVLRLFLSVYTVVWDDPGYPLNIPASSWMGYIVQSGLDHSFQQDGESAGLGGMIMNLLRHDLAFPHLRILILFFMQSSLREMFANIIFNVATWFCHVNNVKTIGDRLCWYQGLFLGVLVVSLASCTHMVAFIVF